MNALELLKDQHDEVDELIARIEASEDVVAKGELFEALADRLAAHAKIEEEIFYPAVMAAATEHLLLEAAEEHLSIKRILADMLDCDPGDKHFDAKLKVIKDLVEHHAREEEEGELFPKVKKLMSADELEGLGGEMLSMFIELMEQAPRLQVPSETTAPAELQPMM